MTQKKFFQLAVMVVGFVWVFCGTFAVALTVQRRSNKNVPVTVPVATTSSPASQQGIFATYPTSGTPVTTSQMPAINQSQQSTGASLPVSTESTTLAPLVTTTEPSTVPRVAVPQDKNEIITAYINGINTLKSTPNFVLNKNDTLNISIDEITGGSMAQSFANTMIPKPVPENYSFVNGIDETSGKTPNEVIAPLNVQARVDPNAVTNAVAQANADGGYTVQLTIKEEIQTNTSPAPNLSTMVQIIDTSSFLPSGAKIQEMTVNYAPSTITASFDNLNRIVSMQHVLVSEGGGTGSMLGFTASMKMHGDYTSDYTISYN